AEHEEGDDEQGDGHERVPDSLELTHGLGTPTRGARPSTPLGEHWPATRGKVPGCWTASEIDSVRVGMLTTSFPRHPSDGAGRFVLDLAVRLVERGHAIEVLAPE